MWPPRFSYPWFFFGAKKVKLEKIICFVDGFNMYYALKNLNVPHLKWLNLQLLFSRLCKSKSQIITQILFGVAYLETGIV